MFSVNEALASISFRGQFFVLTPSVVYKFNHGKVEQRDQVIEAYQENGRSSKNAFCGLRHFLAPHNQPTESKMVKKFQQCGTMADIEKPVRVRAGCSTEIIAFVRENMAKSLNTSIRHRGQELQLPIGYTNKDKSITNFPANLFQL